MPRRLLPRRLLSAPRPESNPIHTSLIVGFAAGALSAALACLLCLFLHQCIQCILRMRRRRQQQTPAQEPGAAAGPIGGLPVTVYDSASGEAGCAVCLADYADGEEVRVLPRCGHAFHRECIDRWLLKGSQACPVCRGLVFGEEEERRPVGPAETGAAAAVGVRSVGLSRQQLL